MIKFDEWWFPDGERHIPTWMSSMNHHVDGRLTYQYHKYEIVLGNCQQWRRAVDVGAHVGLWSYWMARDFRQLDAFEPVSINRDCWDRNVPAGTGAHLHPCALGACAGEVGMQLSHKSTSWSHVVVADDVRPPIEQRTLDSFGFDDVDLIKVDCEGYEVFVLEGARATLLRSKPAVIVEQKPGYATRYGRGEADAVALLQSLGAHVLLNLGGDYICRFG